MFFSKTYLHAVSWFVFLTILGCAQPALAQTPAAQGGFRMGWLEVYGTIGHRFVTIDLPEELVNTPTHPEDMDQFRPPRSQRTPLGNDGLPLFGLGINVRPPGPQAIKNLSVGYRRAFATVNNDFRNGGALANRKPYARFIGGEEAYTYTRVTSLSAISEFRAAYNVLPQASRNGATVDLGAKYAFYDLEITQGWDRFNRDEVYRVTKGDGTAWGVTLSTGIPVSGQDSLKALIRLEFEYEKGRLNFQRIAGQYDLHAITVGYFGIELRF